MNQELRPESFELWGGFDTRLFGGKVRVVGFGPTYRGPHEAVEDADWSFRHFQNSQDSGQHRETAVARFLPEIARTLGVKEIFAPVPSNFNAELCTTDSLKERISIYDGQNRQVTLRRGVHADATILNTPQTFGISVAGCPVVLVWDNVDRKLGIAHAGRQSLISEHKWDTSVPARRGRAEESVIETLVKKMGGTFTERRGFEVYILFAPPPELLTYSWDNPQYGRINEMRSNFVKTRGNIECVPGWEDPVKRRLGIINIEELIRVQLKQMGLREELIHSIGLPSGWYTTRGSFPACRNLILVKRY